MAIENDPNVAGTKVGQSNPNFNQPTQTVIPTTQPAPQRPAPVVGSVEYDIANNLPLGTSSTHGNSTVNLQKAINDRPYTEPTQTTFVNQDPNLQSLSLAQQDRKRVEDQYQTEAKRVNDLISNIQNGTIPLNEGEQAQINGLRNQFQGLIQQQMAVNTGAMGTANIRGYQRGSAEYDPTFQAKTVGSIVSTGLAKVGDLNIKMASAVADLTNSFKEENIRSVKEAYALYQDAYEKRKNVIDDTIKESQSIISAQQKALEDAEKNYYDNVVKPINNIAMEAGKNGATPDQVQAILGSQSVGEAIINSGDSLQTGTGVVGEYLFYKRQAQNQGQVPVDFDTYQTIDANRKAKALGAGGTVGSSGTTYSSAQEKVIGKVETAVSKSPAYTRTASMQTYASNVEAALSQGNGTGDIAAINQFQKVIDEGAVTRDQDVQLIQSAQSISNRLQTKINSLKKGDKLSQEQRNEILKTTNDILDAQRKAIEKDPFIKAKKNELVRNGVDPEDTIFGELGGLTGEQSTSGDIVKNEENAKNQVLSVIQSNPSSASVIHGLIREGISYSDIPALAPELFKVK